MKEDMTQMELQLHPASLGNVRVQVAAKDGVITASFTTQNEQVKAALESQIVVLKENFEQQGIKVEAVEVTVASHAFERNLDSNENSSKDQMTEKKKAVRRINLSNVTDDFEEEGLLEEEKIVADMMRQNGNTVDYTA
ncbi:MAG: flagellar hook-length control protein FliK, partial [Lachnospiraceae bacterium]|nr:flagellar hook-length control protein FliK [Lachnospiraceae bacterium]